MVDLIKKIKDLNGSGLKKIIDSRLKEFENFKDKPTQDWFSELCFCILTANSKAQTALNIQDELGVEGFLNLSLGEISSCIRRNKHRFHNNKARFIFEARRFVDIKDRLNEFEDEAMAREWIALNVKGIGFKEASHFLRNVGYKNLAIVDRHIINLLTEENYLKKKPSTIDKKKYMGIEAILEGISKKIDMSQAELDLYLWYMKTGKVLK